MASAPVGSDAHILEVLDRNNYRHWRSRLETYLLAEDLWEVVEAIGEPPKLEDDQAEYKAWRKKNAKALYAIQNSCGKELYSYISEIKTAKGAWDALEQECRAVQGYNVNNADHLVSYKSFIKSFSSSGDWDKAKKCLGEVDVRSVLVVKEVEAYGEIALHVAAREGQVNILKELVHLMTDEDLKTKTDEGHTALHLAAWKGHLQVVKELPVPLMGGVKDSHGDTALHVAVKVGRVDLVKELILLMRREDLDIKNDVGYTALHLAVCKGNMPVLKLFVTTEKGENDIFGEDDFNPYITFTTYVSNGEWDKAYDCLRELEDPCKAIVTIDPRNDYKDTAFHAAARERKNVDVIKGLVLVLKRRQEELQLQTIEDFVAFGSGVKLGSSEGDVMKRAKYMVQQYEKTLGSILEVQNRDGETALHIAVRKGYFDIVKELAPLMTQEGLEVKTCDGFTALYVAALLQNVDVVKELVPLMRVEGLEIKEPSGNTALNCAVFKGDVDVVKKLAHSMRREGLEVVNNLGMNALQTAAMYTHIHIIKELMPLMSPAVLEKKSIIPEFTPLGWAISRGKDKQVIEIVKYMAEKNNRVFSNLEGPHKVIPVALALNFRKWELARYLYSVTPPEVLNGPNGAAVLILCFNRSETIDMAWDLLQHYPNLATTVLEIGGKKTSPMFKLASKGYAFLSGKQLSCRQRWIYDRIHVGEVAHRDVRSVSISVLQKDVHNNKRDFISSVIVLLRRLAKGLDKLCGFHSMYKMKLTHKKMLDLLGCMGEATKSYNLTQDQLDMIRKSLFRATELGHFEFVTNICKANPNLLTRLHQAGRKGIFHLAIENRQKEIYSLIYGITDDLRTWVQYQAVNLDKTLLHYAANLYSIPQSDHTQDACLQMQGEPQWFKEVESSVPLETGEFRSPSNGMIARELFTKNHEKLMENAESSIKGTATSCTVAGALIITMMFAAAITVPGGNNGNTGLPFFLNHKVFKVFIVSDTISLVSSTSSVITFLGILTSRYAEDDFLESLPIRIMIGLMSLLISIISMMIVFSCALIIMPEGDGWIVIPSILLTSIPIILFVWLLFPLLIKTFISTYGPGIVDKKHKKIIENLDVRM